MCHGPVLKVKLVHGGLPIGLSTLQRDLKLMLSKSYGGSSLCLWLALAFTVFLRSPGLGCRHSPVGQTSTKIPPVAHSLLNMGSVGSNHVNAVSAGNYHSGSTFYQDDHAGRRSTEKSGSSERFAPNRTQLHEEARMSSP